MTVLAKDDHDVAYVTDVEGSWQRLETFLTHNAHVSLDAQGRIVVAPGATFVFGGDAIDRGPWSRKIVRALLEAKLRQPEQVVLLGGNRDLNKLRLARELGGHPPKRAPDDVKALPRAGLLQWIFAHTMGAAEAFEHRRRELSHEGLPHDDDAVAQSYVDDLAAHGELARYLAVCQLTFRSGKTLFVHGGLAEEALTVVPGTPTTSLAHLDVDAWMERLDKFYRSQMQAFCARVIEPDGKPAWEDAILYQAPKKGMKLNPGSVVYGRMADEHNNALLPKADVVNALVRAGIARVVVGHTPSGDTPSIVRSAAQRFEVVNGDNSRSRVQTGSKLLFRDAAFTLAGTAILDDESVRDVAMELHADDVTSPVGMRTAAGDLVKARVNDGWLLFKYLPEYRVTQHVVAETGPVAEPAEPASDEALLSSAPSSGAKSPTTAKS